MTEPLSEAQLADIGWRNRQGLGDSANQFHYFRLSADNRILWGGYDAIYPYGGRVRAEYDDRPETYAKLADHFFTCFPQLEGVRFTPRLGRRDRHLLALLGVLRHRARGPGGVRGGVHRPRRRRDPLRRGRDARPAGGGAHGAYVAGDGPQEAAAVPAGAVRLDGHRAHQVVAGRADAHGGRRNLWLKTMDRLGLGFDS